jgi:8-oxo-dGTP pyrophosphatase MutT (NUDIX family)
MSEANEHDTERHAARVLLLDPNDRILLLRIQEPGENKRAFWITPGGGVEPGETHEQAALRELREETGLCGVPLGPCVWHRKNAFEWLGERLCQVERFYLVRTESFAPSCEEHTEVEAQVLTDFQWWSIDQIAEATHEQFAPRKLASYLKALLEHGPPSEPVEVSA